jgi:hypothetical protein
MRRVYQFGLRPPTEGEALVRAQLRGAHAYRNDLVAIERGRRSALRVVDDTEEVRAAVEKVQTATKSSRKTAVTALREARKTARAAAKDELARIEELNAEITKAAYNEAACAWGTRLDIAAAHQQARSAPLYGDDAIEPSDPKFVRGPRHQDHFPADDPRGVWWLQEGQIAVQLQGGLPTTSALRGDDTRVRIVLTGEGSRGRRYGVLWVRVGSEGRDPVWAKWPIKMHRAIPDAASWKWVRVSLRPEATREHWSVEITVDDPAPHSHERDTSLTSAIAIEWEWSMLDSEDIRVARWADTRGGSGEVCLPASIAKGIRKTDGLRAVRDVVLNEMRPKLQSAIRESEGAGSKGAGSKGALPLWLREAGNTLHLWKSPSRFRDLARRWRMAKCDAARDAYEILDAWEGREMHLYDYECGARREALRERRDWYRCLAARWSREHAFVLLSDQDLSREARFGPESDVRFTASVTELRGALRNAFGEVHAVDTRWRLEADEANEADEAERLWCERVRDLWKAGGARGDGIFAARKEKVLNAWAARKAKKVAAQAEKEGARKEGGNAAESLG